MSKLNDKSQVFSGLQALKINAEEGEKDLLFRNMGQLFAHASNYCNDNQVSQYDDVLCQLAELVEKEAREHVAKLLAPLERAPGSVVLHLAHDDIDVARPLLEFSNVLSDDDLIEIVEGKTEDHRVIIASRNNIALRVGDAISENGGSESITKLIENETASLSSNAFEKAIHMAGSNDKLAMRLRNRKNIDWELLRKEISSAGAKILSQLSLSEQANGSNDNSVSDVVYKRIRNVAGFNSSEWKIAYNQVKALNDRRQLNTVALARFVRFGYGHHVACALSVMMNVSSRIFVKWLATQDYIGITVACKSFGLPDALFEAVVSLLPWRDMPTNTEIKNITKKYESLGRTEAVNILKVWHKKSAKA